MQSIIRHLGALLWMARIHDEREYTVELSLINVCILAVAFGRQLGVDEQDLEKLGLCGLLHDVGKMRVPVDILDKPSELIAKGLSFFTRIIAIVDAYGAMTADHCYSSAKTSAEALKMIYEVRGSHFDEQLALKFIQTIGLYPSGSIVELYTGEVGIVLEGIQTFRHLPRVILLLDEQKNKRAKEKIIDLIQVESGEQPRRFLIKQVWRDGAFGFVLREYQKRGLMLKH